jgi:hypothetical protein
MSAESFLVDRLRNSRVAEAIATLERGEPVDLNRLHLLQALDVVRAGQMAIVEACDREKEFDERAYELAGYERQSGDRPAG